MPGKANQKKSSSLFSKLASPPFITFLAVIVVSIAAGAFFQYLRSRSVASINLVTEAQIAASPVVKEWNFDDEIDISKWGWAFYGHDSDVRMDEGKLYFDGNLSSNSGLIIQNLGINPNKINANYAIVVELVMSSATSEPDPILYPMVASLGATNEESPLAYGVSSVLASSFSDRTYQFVFNKDTAHSWPMLNTISIGLNPGNGPVRDVVVDTIRLKFVPDDTAPGSTISNLD